jgi:phospholipid/cholesterol/gamma-HCH transport system substrate-binding protein
MEEELRKLLTTNNNINVITENLKQFTQKINADNSLWHLLSDPSIANNVRNALVHIELTSDRTAIITGDLSKIVNDVKAGKGTMGALLTDTSFSHQLKQTIINIEAVTDSFAIITGNFKTVSEKIKNGEGAIGTLVSDTSFVHNLNSSMENIKNGSANFNESMEALQHTWPFKKYFKKKTSK